MIHFLGFKDGALIYGELFTKVSSIATFWCEKVSNIV